MLPLSDGRSILTKLSGDLMVDKACDYFQSKGKDLIEKERESKKQDKE